jgi:hypothetical protein
MSDRKSHGYPLPWRDSLSARFVWAFLTAVALAGLSITVRDYLMYQRELTTHDQ